MLNTLMRLLDDSNLNYLENRLYAGLENLKKTFSPILSSLEDKDDHYELVLNVANDAKASNVSVDFDDETRELTVEYKYDSKNYKSRSTVVELLPADADEDSIEATVENGKLEITIWKKEEPEEEIDEEVDDTVVKVNRKNKK